MKTPHRNAKFIKAWADGAEIEWQSSNGTWTTPSTIDWGWPEGRYRIKPERKPDVVTLDRMYLDNGETWYEIGKPNLELTWCGETGQLKSAKVLSEKNNA